MGSAFNRPQNLIYVIMKHKLSTRELQLLSQKFHCGGATAEEFDLFYVAVREWELSSYVGEISHDEDVVPSWELLEGQLLWDKLSE